MLADHRTRLHECRRWDEPAAVCDLRGGHAWNLPPPRLAPVPEVGGETCLESVTTEVRGMMTAAAAKL